jgi:hypothetical protein
MFYLGVIQSTNYIVTTKPQPDSQSNSTQRRPTILKKAVEKLTTLISTRDQYLSSLTTPSSRSN